MARAGHRIFDADTHIIEPVEPIEEHLTAAERTQLAALGPLVGRSPAKAGVSRYLIGKRPALNRRLGSRERVEPPSAAARGAKDGGTPWAVRWQGPPFPSERVSIDPHARVRDMDLEGVDVNMILPSGGVPAFCALEDVALEQAMYRAYHRFLGDYCAPFPGRLTGVLLVSARDPAGSVAEIRRCANEEWPAGILGYLGQRVPAAGGRARVERAAEHGRADRRGRPGSLPAAAPDRARVRPWLACVVGGAPRRARRDVPTRAAAAREETQRVHPRAAVLPEHPDLRGRTIAASRHRVARRGHPHVRHRLPPLGELVPEVGRGGPGLALALRGGAAQAALGQRRALLRSDPHSCPRPASTILRSRCWRLAEAGIAPQRGGKTWHRSRTWVWQRPITSCSTGYATSREAARRPV